MYFTFRWGLLFSSAVLHRCHTVGHGARNPWNCEWNPVCSAEQHQPEVWLISSVYEWLFIMDYCVEHSFMMCIFSPPCAALRLVAALLFRSAWFRSLCSSSSMRFMWVYFQFQHICLNNSWLKMFSPFFQDVGFVLVFSDIHLWASIFSVILVNYIFMDGKCDYFQGKSYWSNSPATIDCGREIPYGLCFHRHCSCGGLLHPVGTLLLCSSSTHLLTCFQKYIYKIP